MTDLKKILRTEVLCRRNRLDAESAEAKSLVIAEKIFALREFQDSRLVMCYMEFRNEVQCRHIIRRCLLLGKKLALPLVVNASDGRKEIIALSVTDPETELERSGYGIMEPRRTPENVVDPKDIDLVVVPGVAFDRQRNRLGYGAGCYDRFLRETRDDCRKIGVAFDLQIADKVPADIYDIQLDMVITEDRVFQ